MTLPPERLCAVCGKAVRETDEPEHLKTFHLGPHYFWFDGQEHRTDEPSLRAHEIYKLCRGNVPPIGWMVEDRDGEWIYYDHITSVDLTHKPHLFHLLPATSLSFWAD